MKTLIIGASSGIGREVARQIEASARAIWAPTKDELDVTLRRDTIAAMLEGQQITHCVYSAGVAQLRWIRHLEDEAFREVFEVNFNGFAKVLSVLVAEHPIKSIVAVSSDAASRPMRGSMMYCASKAALDAAVRVAARELAPLVRVNAVAPGMTHGTQIQEFIDATVPAFRDWTPERAAEYERSQIPMRRRASVEEVAAEIRHVLFGAEYMTGSIITINGGR